MQHRAVGPGNDQVLFEPPLVLQVDLGRSSLGAIERRLRYIKKPVLYDLRHLPEEKGEQERSDVTAVDIRVGHDDDLVVADLLDIELLAADAGAERGDQGADLRRTQHLVKARALDVQDFALNGQDCLKAPVTPLLGGAARRIPLDDEKFGQGWV